MSVVARALRSFQAGRSGPVFHQYQERMRVAVEKVHTAQLQVRQATSIEELDLGRSALQQAYAEIQHLVRSAKRECGIPLRDVSETESMYQQLMVTLKQRVSRPQG